LAVETQARKFPLNGGRDDARHYDDLTLHRMGMVIYDHTHGGWSARVVIPIGMIVPIRVGMSAPIGRAIPVWIRLERQDNDMRFRCVYLPTNPSAIFASARNASSCLNENANLELSLLIRISDCRSYLCSLVQTCKLLQINPFVYLRDVIERVSTHPARLVLELTPREWKRLRRDSGAQAA
jgi:hypothetical protein